ncbi:hypothetical protein LEP1GSC024_1095 [Leptospira noguchii str. 2001034031]|uniref:Uncharacterized protein n=1 Tax=Leptospira noguchii str. 2001034031 TaxID=1193053 RepID=M6YW84_9LEPT|nr:hypothetical protein LEP1GSC024_1095 [Leptospira noguchii str. 2001034031]
MFGVQIDSEYYLILILLLKYFIRTFCASKNVTSVLLLYKIGYC